MRQLLLKFARRLAPTHLGGRDSGNTSPAPHADKRASLMSAVFSSIYESGIWGRTESRSGFGSNLIQTKGIREELPKLVRELRVNSILDIPCGDWYWMRHVELAVGQYIGADVMPSLVDYLTRAFALPGREFRVLDASIDELPRVDMIFSRDCLVHFSFADGLKTLNNFKRSGSQYLVSTTFPNRQSNFDIKTGEWRPINLCDAPFYLPPPIRVINEGCTEDFPNFSDKSLGVWRLSDM
jgi:hypothetical protein